MKCLGWRGVVCMSRTPWSWRTVSGGGVVEGVVAVGPGSRLASPITDMVDRTFFQCPSVSIYQSICGVEAGTS